MQNHIIFNVRQLLTHVLTDNGYVAQFKPISQIRVGDDVLAWDETKAHDAQAQAIQAPIPPETSQHSSQLDSNAQPSTSSPTRKLPVHVIPAPILAHEAAGFVQLLGAALGVARRLVTGLLLVLLSLFLATAAQSSVISALGPHGICAGSSQIDSALDAASSASTLDTPAATSCQKVTAVYTTPERIRTLVHITLDDGQTLTATGGHPFKTEEGWRDAILLKKGGKLLLGGGEEDSASTALRYARIADVRIEQERITTYNLEVAQLHTFLVGGDGVVVHNGSGVYWFQEGPDYYVGKAKSFADRLGKHRRKGRINGTVCKINMPGSSENDRRIMEGFMDRSREYFQMTTTNRNRPPKPKF